MATWYDYFSENMRMTGLSAPQELFGGIGKLKETVQAIATAFATKKMANMTMGQLLSALGDVALPVGDAAAFRLAMKRVCTAYAAVSASYYLGACIGSAGIATYRILSPSQPAPTVFQLTNADIQRFIQEQRLNLSAQRAAEISQSLRAHNTPTKAFGATAAGSR